MKLNKENSNTYEDISYLLDKELTDIDKRYNAKSAFTGICSGHFDLDAITGGFKNSDLIVLGGCPSIGKTSFLLSLVINMALNNSISCGFINLETSSNVLTRRILSIKANINYEKLMSAMLRPSNLETISTASQYIVNKPLFIKSALNISLQELQVIALNIKAEESIKILFIDSMDLIMTENKCEFQFQKMNKISRFLKDLAEEMEIPIITSFQIDLKSKNIEPTLNDLKNMGDFRRVVDTILFLHHLEDEKDKTNKNPRYIKTMLEIAKQRQGPSGRIHLDYKADRFKFIIF